MALKELDIVKTEEIKNVNIPEYQRAYSWKAKSVNTFFDDTYKAYKAQAREYRLGSIILHKKSDGYSIVDGQQRLTTMTILLFCLNKKCNENIDFCLMNSNYTPLSNNAILKNQAILQQRVNDLSEEDCKNYKKYLLSCCTFVKIVTDNEQEAFRFFDSQNSRGKELAPHDLLKSYHLREMRDVETDKKIKIINEWEGIKQKDLKELFENYLYPITQWFRGRDGLHYSSQKIEQFKGITKNNNHNFATYHKASNLFVEQFNRFGNNELLCTGTLNQFQLTQPIIAGSRFFAYSLYYKNLLEDIRQKFITNRNKEEIPDERFGDTYIRQLYECALLFFADKFGLNSINYMVVRILYTWCYLLRLKMRAVYLQTINKHACGRHHEITDVCLFSYIHDMKTPDEINMFVIPKPDIKDIPEENKTKYKEIFDKLCEYNGWEYDDE